MKRHRLPLLAVGFLLLTVAVSLPAIAARTAVSQIPTSGNADKRLASFDQMMTDFLRKHPQVPGAAIAVAKDGRIVYSRGFGHAFGKQVTQPGSRFRIASISKPITAVAILQLIERGRLRLNDRVFAVLDLEEPKKAKFDARWRQVTIEHLLHHTGGWDRDKSFDPMFVNGDVCDTLKIKSPATQHDIIRYMLGQPLDFNPGARYAYSNFGYCLLGRVIEKASGQKYENYVRKEVLAPVGMNDTQLGRTLLTQRLPGEVEYDAGPGKGRAILGPNLGKQVPYPYGVWSLEAMDSHGGWVSTAPDLVRFAVAFNNPNQCRLLKAASVEYLFACPPGAAGHEKNGKEKKVFYACGWNVRVQGPGANRNNWHTGLLDGTSTILVRRGIDRLTWAVLFNGHVPDGEDAASLIDSLVHDAADAVKEWP
jgi:N-acyl-D-amino-acid deacylase